MSTFPTAKDSFVNPTPTTPKNDPAVPLSSAISRLNSAVVAIQDTVGITGSVDPASIQYRLADAQAVAAAADEAISAHVVAGDPHPQYTTQTEVLTLAPAETGSTIGALVVAGADVTSPQDVDLIALSVSSVLRKFSWANMRAALAQIFPLLAGASGGQTINGGTTAGQNLTLRSTAHATKGAIILGAASEYDEANNRLGIGTLTPSATVHSLSATEQLRLGYDASNYLSAVVSSAGVVTLTGTAGRYVLEGPTDAQATATLGSELITNPSFDSDLSGWTAGAGWSWSSGGALHSSGTATLEQSVTVVSGSTYQLDIVITGRTAGSIAIALGAVSVVESGAATSFTATLSRSVVAGATGSVLLAITPTTDFNGAIDRVSLSAVTLGTHPVVLGTTESGTPALEIRQSFSRSNLALGRDSGRSITTGYSNSNVGAAAGYSNTTGHSNSNFGVNAGRSITTGYSNSNVGVTAGYGITTGYSNSNVGAAAGYSNTTGHSNSNVGVNAGRSITTGYSNSNVGVTAGYGITTGYSNINVGVGAGYGITTGNSNSNFGRDAGRNITTGSSNSTFGFNAGRYLADGSTALATPSNCVFIGASTKASADGVTAENVFGYNATGIGSNTTCIGASSNTKTQIYGDIILDKTVTAGGTTGAQTINKSVGSVNFAAGATSLVVTNNRVTASSIIIATVATADATMKSVVAVAASGSFTLTANAAATAETRVNFIVIN
jgi:hypothetical protein